MTKTKQRCFEERLTKSLSYRKPFTKDDGEWDFSVLSSFIGKKVYKSSNKPFKSGSRVNTVKAVVTHELLNIPAFTFLEDDSIVEARRCLVVMEQNNE